LTQITGLARVISKTKIQGWFFSEEKRNTPLSFDLYINHKRVASLTADLFREDIVSKGIHKTGKVGFVYDTTINECDHIHIKFKEYDEVFTVQRGSGATGRRKREQCIIHIGMHKTGSSSIQHYLNTRQHENFSYFDLHRENHSIPIYSLFSEKPETYHIHRREGRTKEEVLNYNEKVRTLFMEHLTKNNKHETFVISGEDISVLPKPSVEKLRDFFSCYFKQIKIIAYVRSPGSFISSGFQEHIKAGMSKFDVNLSQPSYRRRFENFDLLFGRENVELIYYDPEHMPNNDIVSDFLIRLGLAESIDTYTRVNESLSLEATSLLFVFNQYASKKLDILEKEKIRSELIQFLQHTGRQKFMLKQNILKDTIERNRNDIAWIEKRMGREIMEKSFDHSYGMGSEKEMYDTAREALGNLDASKRKSLYEIFDFREVL